VNYQYRAVEKFWRNFYKLRPEQKESVRRAWQFFKGFLCAFVGNTINTDQKFVCKLRAFSIGKSQRVLSQLINGRCHGMIFASGS
jgi:hypothetical protein